MQNKNVPCLSLFQQLVLSRKDIPLNCMCALISRITTAVMIMISFVWGEVQILDLHDGSHDLCVSSDNC